MQKSKFFMGLGAGLVIGALLLQLMTGAGIGQNRQPLLPADPEGDEEEQRLDLWDEPTEQQLRDAAERLSYQLFPADQTVYTQTEVDELLAQQAGEHDVEYAFYIRRNMNLTEVAEMLALFELVEDEQAFIEKVKQSRSSTRIQVGTYTFQGKPTEEQLIEAITSPR